MRTHRRQKRSDIGGYCNTNKLAEHECTHVDARDGPVSSRRLCAGDGLHRTMLDLALDVQSLSPEAETRNHLYPHNGQGGGPPARKKLVRNLMKCPRAS